MRRLLRKGGEAINPRSDFIVAVLTLVLLITSGYTATTAAEDTLGPKPKPTTVCELLKSGANFNGRRVVVRAAVISGGHHGILLIDQQCEGGIRMGKSPHVNAGDFDSFEYALYRQGGTAGTAHKDISADFDGIFQFRPHEPRLKWWIQVRRISNIEVRPKP